MTELSSRTEPDSPLSSAGTIITLKVGERRFLTTPETLRESGFFSALLSGRWNDAQEDGSYFIDADAGIFEHILRYLRRGVFPLFYDNIRGFDYALYLALLGEAKYFQIPRLEKWIEDERYLEAIKTKFVKSVDDSEGSATETIGANAEISYQPFWVVEKRYFCPDGISSHADHPEWCRMRCKMERRIRAFEEETKLRVLVIRKTVNFDPNVCRHDSGILDFSMDLAGTEVNVVF